MLKYLRPGAPFFLIGASAFALYAISVALSLPTPPELISKLSPLYERYGVWFVALCYFAEGLFVLSFYWPGSFVLFVAVLMTPTLSGLFEVWLAINVAAMASIATNVYVGRNGFYKILIRSWKPSIFERWRRWAHSFGLTALAVTGIHANWLALSTVALASFRSHSPGRLWAAAIAAHALWSAALIVLVAQLDLAAISSPSGGVGVIVAFFAIGLAVSHYVYLTQRNRS